MKSEKEGKEKLKKEAGHSRLAGGRLVSKGTYLRGLSWAATIHGSLPLLARILKVYIEVLTELSHIISFG